ncbi:ThiF family adenylyltransferase [Hyalangium minutum]|uniref:Sulfur carrier protein adenylyltransferase ThiF n=1 Tax=Hyalangium minutum TaxID=394096 RepID=A0A085WMG1_9BACT|nr:ThiF family adenylyltransferase [Hyalangium minutum]KFE68874.1 Sulfur carrier protein adenylyltransferase ThiF [Hyalangium minutum]
MKDELILIQGSNFFSFSPNGPQLLEAVRQFDGNRTERELRALPQGEELLGLLEEEQWIVRLEAPLRDLIEGRPWISRQLSFYAHVQRNYPHRVLAELEKRHVLIVGTGGVGSHVAASLAGAGVCRMTLMDPDTIELSNLNRQFFYSREDIGASKAAKAASFLLARHPHLQLQTLHEPLFAHEEQLQRLGGVDLIVFCGDGPTVLRKTAQVGMTPVTSGGYAGSEGIIGPTCWPAKGSVCWGCRNDYRDEPRTMEILGAQVSRENDWNPSGTTVNGLVGNLLAEEALRCLAPTLGGPRLLNAYMSLDMESLALRRIELPPVECPHRTEPSTPQP